MSKLDDLFENASAEEYDLHALAFQNETCSELYCSGFDVYDSVFDHCDILGCRFQNTGFSRVTFDHCDLSGVRFLDCGLKKITFVNCKMMGTVFSGCIFTEAVFQDCMAKLLNLSGNTLKRCRLQQGTYVGASLSNCQLQNVSANACDFSEADFSGTAVKGMDFSGCKIDGARWSAEKLKGACFSAVQATELAVLLGIRIKA